MTSTSSVTQQALLLLLQQEQLQQAATAQAASTKAAADKQATATASTITTTNAASVVTSQAPQVGSGFSAALSQLAPAKPEKSAHDDRHQGEKKVVQAVQSYSEQGPSNATDDSAPDDTAA